MRKEIIERYLIKEPEGKSAWDIHQDLRKIFAYETIRKILIDLHTKGFVTKSKIGKKVVWTHIVNKNG
ncbi:MAG: BlaI/MecI/CopY family transcriptional regulator [Candidatus Thorarchaeota archaeon]